MRKSLAACALALAALLPAARALAWGHKGHMTVAYIAYQQLTPDERQKVFQILQSHPDFEMFKKLAKQDAPKANQNTQQMMIFVEAARWPDLIRDDPRFFDETDKNAKPTPQLAGFPDMELHRPWHFKDNGFHEDGSDVALKQVADNDAQAKIHDFEQLIRTTQNPQFKAYYLAWLLHLAGDVHQPLHCATLVTPAHENGDNGGNGFKLVAFKLPDVKTPVTNLHSFWDDLPGGSTTLAAVKAVAGDAEKTSPDPKRSAGDLNEADWVSESLDDAKTVAYGPLLKLPAPVKVEDSYLNNAKPVALARMKLAGHRLAAVISTLLK